MNTARIGRGALYAALAHVVVVLAAFITGQVVKPSGGGFQDLAAVTTVLLGGEALVGLACLIYGGLRFRGGDRELGVGLVGGWILGLIVLIVLTKLAS
jgi:hypothetical protein